MAFSIPAQLQDKAAQLPENSYGSNRVTLILRDGRKIENVILAWGETVVRVGDREIKEDGDAGFHSTDIVDLLGG